MSKKVKIFAIVVVILAIIIFVAASFGGSSAPVAPKNNNPLKSTTGVVPLPGANQSQANSDEFSNLLSSINQITIDTSLFDNQAYKMLRDFPVALGSDTVGRVNPFAPVGTDLGGNGAPQDVVVQTLQAGKVTGTSAEFGAQLTLNNTTPTSVIFEYGLNDTFGNATTPVVVTKSGTTLFTVKKLLPSTTYYVRADASRGSVTTTGNTTTFTTSK